MNGATLLPGHVELRRGGSPLILSIPHAGTMIPPEALVGLAPVGLAAPDTDWWLPRLYAGIAGAMDATLVVAHVSRFVIDVNRDPSGASLYPGQATTDLCPLTTFDGAPIHHAGAEPDAEEIARRVAAYHAPYHAAIEAEIARIRALHGRCVLYDCHSIRSVIPRLFAGVLPVLNIGTHGGLACAPEVEAAAGAVAASSGFGWVANGRFRGGWITRRYGAPARGVHAIQLELAQRAYMREDPPWIFDPARAAAIEPVLAALVRAVMDAAAAPLP
jgi:formiminoglutamase